MNRSPQTRTAPLAFAFAAAALLAGASSTFAQGSSPAARPSLDANGDGAIDRSEAAVHSRLAEKFDSLDANGDGRLDAAERPQRGGRGGRHGNARGGMGAVLKLDADGDGRISKAETAGQPRLAERFDASDRNRDGYLVRSELEAARAQRRSESAAKRQQRMDKAFAQADANKDGRLSRAEAEAGLPRIGRSFAFFDEDRDGYITRADLAPRKR